MNSHALVHISECPSCSHELCFVSLYSYGPSIAVPCDKTGNVDIDSLTERMRDTYFGARAMIGRAYLYPTVQTRH